MVEENIDEAKDAIEELKKLNPSERLKKLKELTRKDKEELKKAKELLKTTEAEIEDLQKAQRSMPIPELKEVDISALFRKEAEDLESQVAQEPRRLTTQEAAQIEYQANLARQLSEAPSENIYKVMEGLYRGFQSTGYVSSDQMTVLQATLEATQKKMDSIKAGDYSPSAEASQSLVISMRIAKFLQDKYRM